MISKAGLLVVEGGLWVGITERFLNVFCFFLGQVSHPLYCPSTSRPTGTLSFRCALKRSRFKFEQGYPAKVGLSLLKDTNDTFHYCASCWDAVCLCVVTVAVFQVVMSVFHYFYILESEACSLFHIRRSAIGVWETSVLYLQGPVLRMWVTKLSLNVNSLKWARISFFPLSSPQFSHGSLSSNPEKKNPAFLKLVGFKLLEKVAPFKVKNTLQQNVGFNTCFKNCLNTFSYYSKCFSSFIWIVKSWCQYWEMKPYFLAQPSVSICQYCIAQRNVECLCDMHLHKPVSNHDSSFRHTK